MKSENEKDFLKHFEKFFNSINKEDLLIREIDSESNINTKLYDDLENDFERIFFRNFMLVKYGKSLLENIKNLKILYYERISLTDSIITIIDDIKSSAKKIADKNKKIAMKIALLLKKRCGLLKEKEQKAIEFLGFHEIIGKYAIKCGNNMMSIRNFKKECSDFRDIASINYNEGEDYVKKIEELDDESYELILKYKEIHDLFKKVLKKLPPEPFYISESGLPMILKPR